MKRLLHKFALRLERLADKMRPPRRAGKVIDAYAGYATPEHLVVRGRVLVALNRQAPKAGSSLARNFRQMLALFLTNEVGDVQLMAQGVTTTSDEEGYFTLLLPRPAETGVLQIPVQIDGLDDVTLCPVHVPDEAAELLVISDIDDTVLETGAYSLARNLWTSLTGNALTRRIYPDAVRLIADLTANGQNPIFYVSSSPWNLYTFLNEIFERHSLVRGPMFLRDLGLSETKFITDGHGNHKGGSIDLLIRAHPHLPVILMGDTGQKDSAIYAQTVSRHPDRVAAIVLRETADGSDASDLAQILQIEQQGIPVFHDREFPSAAKILEVITAH